MTWNITFRKVGALFTMGVSIEKRLIVGSHLSSRAVRKDTSSSGHLYSFRSLRPVAMSAANHGWVDRKRRLSSTLNVRSITRLLRPELSLRRLSSKSGLENAVFRLGLSFDSILG